MCLCIFLLIRYIGFVFLLRSALPLPLLFKFNLLVVLFEFFLPLGKVRLLFKLLPVHSVCDACCKAFTLGLLLKSASSVKIPNNFLFCLILFWLFEIKFTLSSLLFNKFVCALILLA